MEVGWNGPRIIPGNRGFCILQCVPSESVPRVLIYLLFEGVTNTGRLHY
jgi:hypothetical protein